MIFYIYPDDRCCGAAGMPCPSIAEARKAFD